jgi:hypothetical protein
MNRLMKALLGRPDAVDRLAERPGVVPFDRLLAALGDALLSGPERETLANNPPLLQGLRTGYLPTISGSDWLDALGVAEEEAPANEAGWSTVMIPSSSGNRGLTVPQDPTDADLIVLFAGPPSTAQTLVYDPMQGSLVDLPSSHCSPPSWGTCSGGTCGRCKACRVWDPVTKSKAIRCRCPDQTV